MVLEKKLKMSKFEGHADRQTDGETDERQKKGNRKSSLELSAQVS
jgi:hypothetical protein